MPYTASSNQCMRYCHLFFLGVIPRVPNRIACIVLRFISIVVPLHVVFFSSLSSLAFPRSVLFLALFFLFNTFVGSCAYVHVPQLSPVLLVSVWNCCANSLPRMVNVETGGFSGHCCVAFGHRLTFFA